jgi:hypothetical protein
MDFELKNALTEHNWVTMASAQKIIFRIEVICAILTLVAQVTPKSLTCVHVCNTTQTRGK